MANDSELRMITFWDEREMREAVRTAATDQGLTMSDWLREAVRACLPRPDKNETAAHSLSPYDGPAMIAA